MSKKTNFIELVEESMDPESLLLEPRSTFDAALLGVDTTGRAVYSFQTMVESLVEKDGMTTEEAAEFIEYNTLPSICYLNAKVAPVIVMWDREPRD